MERVDYRRDDHTEVVENMIPKLYAADAFEYVTEGLGRLTECTSCKVTEERNGGYECQFTYPIGGKLYEQIKNGCVITCPHNETGDLQPFVIYRISKPINGVATFYAHHVSYLLSGIVLDPFRATSCASALSAMRDVGQPYNPFTYWTDKVTEAEFRVDVPVSARAILGGMEGSILDVFGGGEYEFDKYQVKLWQNRGTDSGVTIRYGKNLTDITDELDTLDVYDSVVPYWLSSEEDGQCIYGGVVVATGVSSPTRTVVMDLSGEYQNAPTVAQLESKAQTILDRRRSWIPKRNIKIDFVALWQTEEYAQIAPLERVNLCDTVTVVYPDLDVNVSAKVIKTVYNVLLDRYDEIELGEPRSSFGDVITAQTDAALAKVPTTSMMQAAIDYATSMITGGQGGHVVFRYDANEKPTEILIMDTEDESTAVNVLRINMNGIGFSSNGVNGPFTTAWTIDGHFVANFIDTGQLSANVIYGGVIQSVDGKNKWDLTGGLFSMTRGSINLGSGKFVVTDAGAVTIKNGTITMLDSSNNILFSVSNSGSMQAKDAIFAGHVNFYYENYSNQYHTDFNGIWLQGWQGSTQGSRLELYSNGLFRTTGTLTLQYKSAAAKGFTIKKYNSSLDTYYDWLYAGGTNNDDLWINGGAHQGYAVTCGSPHIHFSYTNGHLYYKQGSSDTWHQLD